MNKYLSGGIVAAVIVIGAMVYFAQNNPAAAPAGGNDSADQAAPTTGDQNTPGISVELEGEGEIIVTEAQEIEFTDSGYAPSTLTVKKGAVVIYRNDSSGKMWPASAKHPTHEAYPVGGGCIGSAFDACAAIAPGGTWAFTFNEVGTWKYHDHLNPSYTGTVVVQ